jgi:hypothetical protein
MMSRFLSTALTTLLLSASPAFAGDGDWGTVKGRVVYKGPAPAPKEINVTKDQDHCLLKGPLFSEELVVNPKNNGVRWAFVWLIPEQKGAKIPIHPNLLAIKDKQVSIDQPCCQFVPHALGMREGQELVAKNSAPLNHNVHWTGHPLKNPGGNVIVPSKKSFTIEGLKADRFPVKINCDIHGWMSAWVRVFDHPYFAVTDKDGNFEIKLAPAGQFRLMMWQEEVGWIGGRDGVPVTIQGGGVTDTGESKLIPNN